MLRILKGGKMQNTMFDLVKRLLLRSENTDDLSDYPNWRIGLSMAASWSWGVSMAACWYFMGTYGRGPTFGWLVGNVLALPFFGLVHRYLPMSKNWPRFIFPMVFLFLFVETSCIIINLQGVLNGLGGQVKGIDTYPLLTGPWASRAVIMLGVFVIAYIYKGGLKLSVLTDYAQYSTQLIAVMFLAALGLIYGAPNDFPMVATDPGGVSGLEWVKWAPFGTLMGTLGTSHQWQRVAAIKKENILKASVWGGFFFGVYMFFVWIAGIYFLSGNIFFGITFLIIMVALATSSIDSSIAGYEYVVAKLNFVEAKVHYRALFSEQVKIFVLKPYHIATTFSFVVVLFLFPMFVEQGLGDVWNYMAKQRLKIVATFFIVTVILTLVKKVREVINGKVVKDCPATKN